MFRNTRPKVTSEYSFDDQEAFYSRFRPSWPIEFAIATLEQAGVLASKTTQPTVVCIGSGAGADAAPFIQLGCRVYGVEPNAKLRALAQQRFAKYGDRFCSIDGTAHQFELPAGVKADVIICAQALHTFSSKVNSSARSESKARQQWKTILPDDERNRLAIWYYNLNCRDEKVVELDEILKKHNPIYAASKTSFVDAKLCEPTEFQHYIKKDDMTVSTAQAVDLQTFGYNNFIQWLSSYSFFPKEQIKKAETLQALQAWFNKHQDQSGNVQLQFVGFITQGPLRSTPYFALPSNKHAPVSPISSRATDEPVSTIHFWPEQVPSSNLKVAI